MDDFAGGGETDPPGETSVCIEKDSQNNKENENLERDDDFRVIYKGRLEKERKFLIPYKKLDDHEPEKESTDKVALQNQRSKSKSSSEGYALSKKYIGTAVIVNNLDREQPSTKADVHVLSELLKKTGFQTHVFLNCTKGEMNDLRRKFILKLDDSTRELYEQSSSFVLIVIAHGETSENTNKEFIFDISGETAWNVKIVENQLNRVEALKGKPKLIIVEACRGKKHMKKTRNSDGSLTQTKQQASDDGLNNEDEEDEEVQNLIQDKNKGGNRSQLRSSTSIESTQSGKHAEMKDQMVCFATVPDYVALTLTKSGSAYLQMLAKKWKALMYLEQLTDIHTQVTSELANKPVMIQKEEYQVPQYRTTLDKQFNSANYLFGEKEEFDTPMKGHVYFEGMSKDSIIGRGYNISKNQLKYYNIFERYHYLSEYEVPEGEPKTEMYFIPKGVEVIRESKEQSYLEHMPNPTKKDGMATITYHKEFRTTHISFKDISCGNGKTSMQPFLRGDSQFSDRFKNSLKADNEKRTSQELTNINIEDFFDFWDNNFVVSHYMGGSVTVTILVSSKSKMLKDSGIEEETLKDHMDKIFSGTALNDEKMHKDLKVVDIEFQGGLIEDVPESFDEITHSQIRTWIKSIPTNPIPLTTEMTLAPIHLVAAEVDSGKGELILKKERERRKEEKGNVVTETNEERKTCFLYTNKIKDTDTVLPKNTKISGSKLVKYIGDTENSEMQGDGRGYFTNGDVYIGQWREGKPEGLGTWYYRKGKHISHLKGIFKDGEITNTLSGRPKKKLIEKKSCWLKSFISFITVIIMIVVLGRELWPEPPTCIERIHQEWKKSFYRNEPEHTWTYKELNISSLNPTTQRFCNGESIYIDSFSSELNCSSIDIPIDDSQTHVYEFKLGYNLTANKPLYPQWDKQFRIRSCKAGTNCKDFFCVPPSSPTCTERIHKEWEKIYYINGQNKDPELWRRAFMKFEMSNLNLSTRKFCNGSTVYIDDLPHPSTIGIPDDDSRSRVYEFNFLQKMNTKKILHPHGDKQFRIRSCKADTNCKKSLTNSRDFMWVHNERTKFRNLTCPETIVYKWKHITAYNKTDATLKVDLTNLTERCHLGNQPVYMEVVAVDKEHTWEDCHDITTKNTTMAFSQIFKFNKTTEIQEVKFFSGHFIIRFKQGSSSCGSNNEVSNCEYYECTSMLTHYDQQENDIFQVWRNTGNNTNRFNPKSKINKLKINLESSTNCTLDLKKIPLYQVFSNTSYLTAQVSFTQVNNTEVTCRESNAENSRKEKIWVEKSSTYINSTKIYQVHANSTYYCFTIHPNYPFCGPQDSPKKCECHYQAIFECSNCSCKVKKDSKFPDNCKLIYNNKNKNIYNFPVYIQDDSAS